MRIVSSAISIFELVTKANRRESLVKIQEIVAQPNCSQIYAFFYMQLYCAQWFGKEHIMCGGCEQNTARIIDRGTLNVSAHNCIYPFSLYESPPKLLPNLFNSFLIVFTSISCRYVSCFWIVTARKGSCGKVMSSQVSVCLRGVRISHASWDRSIGRGTVPDIRPGYLPPTPGHQTWGPTPSTPGHQTWGTTPPPLSVSEIWWWSLETCLNLLIWGPTPSPC